MSITSLLMTALTAFVLLVPALMVAVLASGVPMRAPSDHRQARRTDAEPETADVPADLPVAA